MPMPTPGSTQPISFSSVGGWLKEKKAKSNVVARGPGPLPMQMPGRVVYMSGKDYFPGAWQPVAGISPLGLATRQEPKKV